MRHKKLSSSNSNTMSSRNMDTTLSLRMRRQRMNWSNPSTSSMERSITRKLIPLQLMVVTRLAMSSISRRMSRMQTLSSNLSNHMSRIATLMNLHPLPAMNPHHQAEAMSRPLTSHTSQLSKKKRKRRSRSQRRSSLTI
jgi:hypothetical protein